MSMISVFLNKIGLKKAAENWFASSRIFEKIKAEVFDVLPKITKLRAMSPDERRATIVAAVEAIVNARYPHLAAFIDVLVEAIAKRIAAAFTKKK